MPKVFKQIAGWCHVNGHDKVWAAAVYDDGTYRAKWGKRGSALQYKVESFHSVNEAMNSYDKKRYEKLVRGDYEDVPFDTQLKEPYDEIQSFKTIEDDAIRIRFSSSFEDLI